MNVKKSDMLYDSLMLACENKERNVIYRLFGHIEVLENELRNNGVDVPDFNGGYECINSGYCIVAKD